MRKHLRKILVIVSVLTIFLFFYCRWPIVTGKYNGQTIYLAIINCFHVKEKQAHPRFMLIDDDSGPGIFKIREISERIGVKATFAVVPSFLDSVRCDSLRKWQQEGYGIALHGFNHGRWKDWNKKMICEDIDKSLKFLRNRGFDIDKVNIVVSPSFYNTQAIRSAVSSKGMKLVIGANIVNPDITTFQWGRFFVKKDEDVNNVYKILLHAKKKNGFVILGTHSSIDDEFSIEKTESILKMVVDLGFTNINYIGKSEDYDFF